MTKHKEAELVHWGSHELNRGRSLSQVEHDLLKEGLTKKDAISTLKKIEAAHEVEEHQKAMEKREAEKKAEEEKAKAEQQAIERAQAEAKTRNPADANANPKRKSSWLLYFFIALIVLGVLAYVYYSDILGVQTINFK